jgi:hypothetical protein
MARRVRVRWDHYARRERAIEIAMATMTAGIDIYVGDIERMIYDERYADAMAAKAGI